MVRIVKLIVGVVLFSTPLMLPAQVFEFEDPEPLPFNVNSDAQEVLPLLSHDGKALYFSRSLYDQNVGGTYSGDDIWESERTSSGWTRALNYKARLNTRGNDALIGINR